MCVPIRPVYIVDADATGLAQLTRLAPLPARGFGAHHRSFDAHAGAVVAMGVFQV